MKRVNYRLSIFQINLAFSPYFLGYGDITKNKENIVKLSKRGLTLPSVYSI